MACNATGLVTTLLQKPQIPEFPQLEHYLQTRVSEKDLDHDGSPVRMDIDGQDSRTQVARHYDKRDGSEGKTTIRERLHSAKVEAEFNHNEKQNHKEMEIFLRLNTKKDAIGILRLYNLILRG